MKRIKCQSCGRAMEVPDNWTHRPFCSDRCKMADLSRWLDEDYVISRPVSLHDLEDVH